MQLLDDFKENADIFNGSIGRIDQATFDKLIEERGIDFARGFLSALFEVNTAIANVTIMPGNEPTKRIPETKTAAYGKLNNFHKALFSFLKDNGLPLDDNTKPVNHKTKTLGW